MPREYHENGAKETPTPWYYSLETTFYEFVSRSAHRTLDPKEADFFFAPTAAACFQIAYNSPSPRHWAEALPVPSRAFGVFSFWESLWRDDISTRIRDPVIANARAKRGYKVLGAGGDPDGNETKDLSDHIFIAPYDEGACVLPPSLKSGIFLTHWGNDGSKHARSTSAYWPDRWDTLQRPVTINGTEIPDILQGRRCYDPANDLVVPPWNRRGEGSDKSDPRFWVTGKRDVTFFFAGDLGTAAGIAESGPHGAPLYSLGIRQRVTKLLRDRTPDGFQVKGHVSDYDEIVQRSTFCGAFPGDGWSGGILTYLKYGCIRVVGHAVRENRGVSFG